MANSSQAAWHVKLAIDALNEGYRCLSARLNAILRVRAPGVQIDCDPVRPRDSMERAREAFRQALPGLRTLRPLPSRDYEICPWTLGYVNDNNNSPIMLGASERVTDDVESALNFLASDSRAYWKPEHWQANIVDPIQQHHKAWFVFLEACQGHSEPVGNGSTPTEVTNRNDEAAATRGESDGPLLDAQSTAATSDPAVLGSFTRGEIVFYADRVELCGVDICSGRRSSSKRIVLELLSQKHDAGNFVAFSGDELEKEVKDRGGKGAAVGLIRDLRQAITTSLREASIVCGSEDVILSGGPGYRFAESLSVHHTEQPEDTDVTDGGESDCVPDVPDVSDVSDVSDDVRRRRDWILEQLGRGVRLKAPAVAEHFKCSVKTAQRDLAALKDEGKIEYVGTPRTGYYQLCQPPETTQ